jgi:ribosome-associated protein
LSIDTGRDEEEILIATGPIRLDQLLKLSGAVHTGGQAKHLIQSGRVQVNGVVERRRGFQLSDQDVVILEGGPVLRVVVGREQPGGER